MLSDPFSLASSIITFIDGVSKLKDSLSKIPESSRRLRQVKMDVLRELDALERFCRSRYLTWNGEDVEEVKTALMELQSEFRDVQALCEIHLAAKAGGILRPARLKSWFKRNAIETDIRRLEQNIRSCQFRFMLFSSARTEYNTVVNQQENRDRLGHIENLVSYMLLRNERSNTQPPFSFLHADAPDEVDLNFLSYQIQKVADGLDSVMSKWQSTIESPPSGRILIPERRYHVDLASFRKALIYGLRSRRAMSSSDSFTLHGLVIPIIELVSNAMSSSGSSQTTLKNMLKLAKFSVDASEDLYSLNQCDPFEQMLAYARYHASNICTFLCDPRALSFTEQAVSTWQARFERHGDPTSLLCLSFVLLQYNVNLFRHNKLEEALDCSRQVLLILRMSQELDIHDGPIVTWHASGEANIVFSSSRIISRSSSFAAWEAICLWTMAVDLSLAGRYAEARVAGADAISCLRALRYSHPGVEYLWIRLPDWTSRIHGWVSIIPNPSSSEDLADSTSIEEVGFPSLSSSPSTSSLALMTSSSYYQS
ncbi:hypothetical protein HGRIS_014956 [Hohenbuehelia grisea]|uniref:Fungal N-terminal domain-containing protein n=1 Tax=Hohenbuehelia grisea TaxID=104357 RepID=A0ABR3IZM6_9AGAR